MTERDQQGAEKLTRAFEESYRTVMGNAVDVQTRNFELAQGWVDGLTGLLESQTEANKVRTKAMESYAKVVDEALKCQERTNRALAESMDSYREAVEKVSETQEKNTDLTRSFFEGVTGELRQGAEGNEAMARDLTEGSRKQMEAFRQMLEEATSAYTKLMSAPFDVYRENPRSHEANGTVTKSRR